MSASHYLKPTRLAIILIIFKLSGCSVINIHTKNNSIDGVTIERNFGIPIFRISPQKEAIYFETKGIGLITAPTGLSLGLVNQTYASVPKDTCTAVFFVNDRENAKEIIEYLKSQKIDLSRICIK